MPLWTELEGCVLENCKASICPQFVKPFILKCSCKRVKSNSRKKWRHQNDCKPRTFPPFVYPGSAYLWGWYLLFHYPTYNECYIPQSLCWPWASRADVAEGQRYKSSKLRAVAEPRVNSRAGPWVSFAAFRKPWSHHCSLCLSMKLGTEGCLCSATVM